MSDSDVNYLNPGVNSVHFCYIKFSVFDNNALENILKQKSRISSIIKTLKDMLRIR